MKTRNSIILTGNLVADASTFNGAKGSVTKFTIAHSQGKNNPALFVDVKVLAKAGEENNVPMDILKKGNFVQVTGRLVLETREYDGKNYKNLVLHANAVAEPVDDGTAADDEEDLPEEE